MSSRTSKSTRTAKGRVRNQTERSMTVAEYDGAMAALIKDGQFSAIRKGFFCERSRNIPIAGTGCPLPCPFCGKDDDIYLEFTNVTDQKPYVCAKVSCGVCGAEAPAACTTMDDIPDDYAAALKAARYWNTRGRLPE